MTFSLLFIFTSHSMFIYLKKTCRKKSKICTCAYSEKRVLFKICNQTYYIILFETMKLQECDRQPETPGI